MKKNIIIVISIVLVLVLAVGSAYLVDRNRMKNNKPVIFSTWGYSYAPPIKDSEINYIVDEPFDEVNENNNFFGTVIESKLSYIIVKPRENEEIRKSADKIHISLGENNDALYAVGTNVKITYKGGVMETYPAQVNAINIEIKSAEEFEIKFNDESFGSLVAEEIAKIKRGLTEKEGTYSVYSYGGDINILIDGEELSLKEALENNRITMNEIIQKANKDFPDAVSYDDGGTKEYHYENYTIIKCHMLDGNRDIYICKAGTTLNDLDI